MAVHAFQAGVATLYERMTEARDPLTLGRDWKKRFRQIVEINREGAETVLRHGQPTPVGEGLLREMREIEHISLPTPSRPNSPPSRGARTNSSM